MEKEVYWAILQLIDIPDPDTGVLDGLISEEEFLATRTTFLGTPGFGDAFGMYEWF